MNINDVLNHSNRDEANDVIDRELGYYTGSVNGWGPRSFSVSLKSGTNLSLRMEVIKLRKNAKVRVFFMYPCLGLPMENNLIGINDGPLEFDRVGLDSDFGSLVKNVYRAARKSSKMIEKKYGKKAVESERSKSLWSMTI